MKTILRFKAIIGAFALLSFSPRVVIPANASEASVRKLALLAWAPAVETYRKADTQYNIRGDANAFAKALPKGTLTAKDEAFLRKQLKGTPALPKAEMTETGFRLSLDGQSVDITVVDAETGQLRIGSQDFTYDRSGGLEKNSRLAWTLVSTLKPTTHFSFADWLVPSAHAEVNWKMVIGIGLAVLGAVLLTWYLTKKSGDKKAADLQTQVDALKAKESDIQVDSANTTPSSSETTVIEHSDTTVE